MLRDRWTLLASAALEAGLSGWLCERRRGGFGSGSATFALGQGATAYEPKPINPENFMATVKRLIEPDEVAEAVAFLCGPASWTMTGSVLTLDAGRLAH